MHWPCYTAAENLFCAPLPLKFFQNASYFSFNLAVMLRINPLPLSDVVLCSSRVSTGIACNVGTASITCVSCTHRRNHHMRLPDARLLEGKLCLYPEVSVHTGSSPTNRVNPILSYIHIHYTLPSVEMDRKAIATSVILSFAGFLPGCKVKSWMKSWKQSTIHREITARKSPNKANSLATQLNTGNFHQQLILAN